jgi:hypothetical protein
VAPRRRLHASPPLDRRCSGRSTAAAPAPQRSRMSARDGEPFGLAVCCLIALAASVPEDLSQSRMRAWRRAPLRGGGAVLDRLSVLRRALAMPIKLLSLLRRRVGGGGKDLASAVTAQAYRMREVPRGALKTLSYPAAEGPAPMSGPGPSILPSCGVADSALVRPTEGPFLRLRHPDLRRSAAKSLQAVPVRLLYWPVRWVLEADLLQSSPIRTAWRAGDLVGLLRSLSASDPAAAL